MSVFRDDTHETVCLPRLLNHAIAWRMLDTSERRTDGVRGGCRGAGRERGPLRRRRRRQSCGLHLGCPAEGELSRPVRKRSTPAGAQNRGWRHNLAHDLGKCRGRALRRGAATTTPNWLETDDRAASAGVAPAGPIPGIGQPFGTPNQPPGAPAETPPPGQTPSTNTPQTVPLPTEGISAGGQGQSATFPDQQVAPDGAITVPYAGRVPAAGRTPAEVQQTIEALLADKALQPQALVIVRKSDANAVTVAGEVVAGARVPLTPGGDRVLQVIAAAGGANAPVYETFVRLSRHGVTATIPLERLIADPAEDIYAQPGDVLTLVRVPQTFSVFGAAGRNAAITFDAEKLTLSEALAKSQGLD